MDFYFFYIQMILILFCTSAALIAGMAASSHFVWEYVCHYVVVKHNSNKQAYVWQNLHLY